MHCINEEDLFSDKSEETDCGTGVACSCDVLDDMSDTSTTIVPDVEYTTDLKTLKCRTKYWQTTTARLTTDDSAVESDEVNSQGTKSGNPRKPQTSTRKRALDSTYMEASRIANFSKKISE